MARKSKEVESIEEVKVEDAADPTQEVVNDVEVQLAALKETLEAAHQEELAVLQKKIAKLESDAAKQADTKQVVKLTAEQKAALEHCFKWLQHFVRRSSGVEFRQQTKDAMAALSTLL